ncbi:hypothetical protein [Methylobacterium sp. C1]|uniref:hypothetical protein n=1 Tax=Methylobacterium sp. C1 TaxID=1479019 RepID=UPI0008DA6635|nr:hypothetical protein [Methylobacterium sp. C1]
MPKVETLAATLCDVAVPGMSRKDLVAAVRERHPEVTKKEVVRAAFYALTDADAIREEQARHLHEFALAERVSDVGHAEPAQKASRRGKKVRKRDASAKAAAAPLEP